MRKSALVRFCRTSATPKNARKGGGGKKSGGRYNYNRRDWHDYEFKPKDNKIWVAVEATPLAHKTLIDVVR